MKSEKNQPSAAIVNELISADYSEIYRKQETKQLNKRLKRTRNILFVCAFAALVGGLIFWLMPEKKFSDKQFLSYIIVALVFAGMAILSKTEPYKILLVALLLSLMLWGLEIISGKATSIILEGSIHKLFIISLMISSLHTSREAELIKRELCIS
jgi:hypothetical protein